MTRCSSRAVAVGFAAVLALASGCALLGEQEMEAMERLPVIADDRPFDPSQAVDDDDDLERPWHGTGDTEDADAFAAEQPVPADERAQPASARREHRAHAADASARGGGDAAASRSSPPAAARAPDREVAAKPGQALGRDERIATPAEVDAQREQRRREHAASNSAASGDAEAKTRLASNPPAEAIGDPKPTAWTIVDYALEGVVIAAGALAVSLLVTLARRAPKTALAIAFGVVAFVAGVIVTQGE